MRTRTKALMRAGNGARQRRKLRLDPANVVFAEETNQGLIQWPTQKQLLEVSKQLAKISRTGIRAEASGDYFNSGDLAYQLEEILRATAELLKRSERVGR
jgi:hypothetical protein